MSLRVHFYDNRPLDFRVRLISLFIRDAAINHCSLEYDGLLCTLADKRRGVVVVPASHYHHTVCSPTYTLELGIVDSLTFLEPDDTYRVSGFKYLTWHLIGKHLGMPAPRSCAVHVSNILMKHNKLDRVIFYPDHLHKELTNADDNYSRSSGDR